MFSATKYLVAGIILALLGGFLLNGISAAPVDEETLVVGAPTSEPLATPTSPAPMQQGLVAGTGPWLVWEQVPADRVPEDRSPKQAGESPIAVLNRALGEQRRDYEQFVTGMYGLAWSNGEGTRSDKHGLLDGYKPLRLMAVGPSGRPHTKTFDRAYRVQPIVVGPTGILARISVAVTRPELTKLAVDGRTSSRRDPDCCQFRADGSVRTDGSGGLPKVIRFDQWRDRLHTIGLRRADLTGRRHTWLWQDGSGWREVEQAPGGKMYTTDDGLYVLDGKGRLHHSQDGSAWAVIIDTLDGVDPVLGGVGDDLLLMSPEHIAWVEPTGLRQTAFVNTVAEDGPFPTLLQDVLPPIERGAPWGPAIPLFQPDAGPVLIHAPSRSVILAPDDEHWGLTPVPSRPAGTSDPDSQAPRTWDFKVIGGDLFYQPDWDSGSAYRAVVSEEPPSPPDS